MWLLLGLLMLVAHSGVAQPNFVEGYIISTPGDTTYGYIDYREWVQNPSSIRFREHKTSSTVRYEPSQLHAFQVADVYYRAQRVRLDTTPRNSSDGPVTPTYRMADLFLQVLLKGHTSLYYYRDTIDHFFIGQGDSIQELIYRVVPVNKDGRQFMHRNELYKVQLLTVFSGCLGDMNVENLDYSSRELIKIFSDYNACMGEQPQYVAEPEYVKIRLGLLAGGSLTKLNINKNNARYYSLEFSGSRSVVFGISANFIFPSKLDRWSIYSDLIYKSTAYKDEHPYIIRGQTISSVKASYVKLTVMGRYKFFVDKFEPFVNLGGSYAQSFDTENHALVTFDYNDVEVEYPVFPIFDKNEVGVVAGVGTYLNNFSIEFRYERGSGPGSGENTNTSTNQFYFIAGYQF